MNKTCTICKCELPIENFERIGKGRYGYRCKPCRNMKTREYESKNPEKKKARDKRWRKNNPIKSRESDRRKRAQYNEKNILKNRLDARIRARQMTDEQKEIKKERERIWRLNNPEKIEEHRRRYYVKIKARRQVHSALRRNLITKPKQCQLCLSEKPLQGHHSDYTKPLEVFWLCSTCHGDVHHLENIKTSY